MSKRWKLFTLVALFAFGVTLISWPRSAQADLGTLTTSVASATIGQTITVTGSLSNVSGASVTLVATPGTWVSGSVSTGETVSGTGTPVLSFVGGGSTVSSTLTATYACTTTGTVTFTLSQNPAPATGATFLTATLQCGAAVSPTIVVTPPTAAVNMPATVSATCTAAAQLLNATGTGTFVAFPSPVNATVVSPSSVSCNAAGSLTVTFICGADGIVTFTLNNASGTLYCGNTGTILAPFCPNGSYPYGAAGYPYATGLTGYPYGNLFNFCNLITTPVAQVTSLTVSTSSPQVSCGGNAFVTIRVSGNGYGGYGAYGSSYVADGTEVTMSTTAGTLNPTSATTVGGSVLATFTAPATSGLVTISAASGSATHSATINVDCPVIVLPAPTQVAQVVVPSVISPPNTGDAGLVDLLAD
jgi:hypothetical protein